MDSPDQQIRFLSTLLHLEQRLRDAANPQELAYRLANETRNLIQYDQLIVWERAVTGRITIRIVSGIDRLDPHTPFLKECRDLCIHLLETHQGETASLNTAELPTQLSEQCGARNWAHLLFITETDSPGQVQGGMLVVRTQTPWTEQEEKLFDRLSDTYRHAARTLSPWRKKPRKHPFQRLVGLAVFILFIAAMIMPVHLSTLAPAEVVSTNRTLITAPMDGIVSRFMIQPNQVVTKGQRLVELNQTTLKSQLTVARKAYEVTKTRFQQAQQRSFNDAQAREQVQLLQAQMLQKKAEAEFIETEFAKTVIEAPADGIAVFRDEDDWLGRPVATGQRILILADPDQVELEIQLPINDAITLEGGSQISFFQNVAPTKPLAATLNYYGYQASFDESGTLFFPLKATFTDPSPETKLGLRGSAKLFGRKVPLIYAILRRPLTSLRQFIGF